MNDATTMRDDIVGRYFELDAERDVDAILAPFSDDATVIDEGKQRRGTVEIRVWRTGDASRYTYTTEVLNTVAHGPDRRVVTGRLRETSGAASQSSRGTSPSPETGWRGWSSPVITIAPEGLAGKRALVRGGTRGIGAAIAARLEVAGAHVTTPTIQPAAKRHPWAPCRNRIRCAAATPLSRRSVSRRGPARAERSASRTREGRR